ncbi:PREDICTED: CASP-like protein 1C1 [Nelumbo nucifera]|uniref:CASP-like protein n=2 Tax=Nelumbo nucifera TaxID=4432 RepID=A0A1U8AWQ4_NELNU|nr:PREDICTED: CASP-like protein 1C1 [Nelumbo nucifera]DAD20940.1 TPA_asm: hypothetical protein HUJ06_022403 [Nelumbo nucifera]
MEKKKRAVLFVFRFLAFAAAISATIVMATSNENAFFYGIELEASYNNSPALTYFVIAYSIVTVYGFLLLFLPPSSKLWQFVVAVDVIATVLVTSSFSAALAVAYVGKQGNSSAGWLPICDQVSDFCKQIAGALVAGFAAMIIYTGLLLYSIHTVLDPLLVFD